MSGIISDNVGRSSGLVKSAAVSSDFVKLGRVTLGSSATTMTIDNYFTADYQHYKFICKFRDTGNNNNLYCRIVTGGDGTVASASSYRGFHGGGETNSGSVNNTQSNKRWGADSWQLTGAGSTWYGDQAQHWSWIGEINYVDPLSTTKYQSFYGLSHFIGGSERFLTNYMSGYYDAAHGTASTGIQFIETGATIEVGSYVDIYGIK